MRQIYPADAGDAGDGGLADAGLAALYAYPDPGTAGSAPWLRANMVASLDGAATVQGRAAGLSSEGDRQVFAMLRALADVILVGAGTARAERYAPVRPETELKRWAWLRAGRTPSPPIAVVTHRLSLDLDGALVAGAPEHAKTILITTEAAPAARRAAAARTADVLVLGEASVDIPAALDELAKRGHPRILAEGGPHLLSEIACADRLDELCLTVSPLLTGPGTGPWPRSLAHVLAEEGYLFCRYLRPS